MTKKEVIKQAVFTLGPNVEFHAVVLTKHTGYDLLTVKRILSQLRVDGLYIHNLGDGRYVLDPSRKPEVRRFTKRKRPSSAVVPSVSGPATGSLLEVVGRTVKGRIILRCDDTIIYVATLKELDA